jgi:hypothetical protein
LFRVDISNFRLHSQPVDKIFFEVLNHNKNKNEFYSNINKSKSKFKIKFKF